MAWNRLGRARRAAIEDAGPSSVHGQEKEDEDGLSSTNEDGAIRTRHGVLFVVLLLVRITRPLVLQRAALVLPDRAFLLPSNALLFVGGALRFVGEPRWPAGRYRAQWRFHYRTR